MTNYHLGTWNSDYYQGSLYANNQVMGFDGNDTLKGGFYEDSLYGGNGDDQLQGNSGNDRLFGEVGNDRIFGDDGDDEIRAGDGNDSVWGGNGNDTISGQGGYDNIYGGAGNDWIFGNGFINAGGNDDHIYTAFNGTADTVYGGTGADRFEIGTSGPADIIADLNIYEGDKLNFAVGSSDDYHAKESQGGSTLYYENNEVAHLPGVFSWELSHLGVVDVWRD